MHLADRTSEALEAIKEAEALVERSEARCCLPNYTGFAVFFFRLLVRTMPKLSESFREAISTAKEQKSISLEKRAEGTYAEYRRQKASGLEGRGFRLPLY